MATTSTEQSERVVDEAAGSARNAFASARLAWENAPRLCPGTGFGCLPYHRIRPLLRRLGLAAEPADQRTFLFPALVDALARVGTRVLVSGSVDEAMAAMVIEAGNAAKCVPRITVLDRCATPLVVNEAFGKARGIAVAAVQGDILGYRTTDPFDLIVTHSFLGQFAPSERPQLMARWIELLRPGGRVITVARLRPTGENRSFSQDAPARLAAEVLRRALKCADEIAIEPEDLAKAALEYAMQRAPSFPLHNLEEAERLFESAGFRLPHAQLRESRGRVVGIEGPGLPRGGTYAEVIAVRP